MTLIPDLAKHQEANKGSHRSGTLPTAPLKRMEELLSAGFGGENIRTAETGCGASTVLFAHYADEHHVYALDDREIPNSSVIYAKSFPSFENEKVKWHFGPTQRTLLENQPAGRFHMVLLDGSHGYPWPEVEYSLFYRLLPENGILIIDDIHIPSIRNMFAFLAEDDMFYLDQVVHTTAFFRRSDVPLVLPDGDNWYTQRYNVQQFPVLNPLRGTPIANAWVVAETNISELQHYVKRGFTRFDGKFATEGRLSMLEFPFQAPMSGTCRVSIAFEPLFAAQRLGAGVGIYLNNTFAGHFELAKEGRFSLRLETELLNSEALEIKFHNAGYAAYEKIFEQLHPAAAPILDKRLLNFAISSLEISVDRLP
jgi:Methyltransferase domain